MWLNSCTSNRLSSCRHGEKTLSNERHLATDQATNQKSESGGDHERVEDGVPAELIRQGAGDERPDGSADRARAVDDSGDLNASEPTVSVYRSSTSTFV